MTDAAPPPCVELDRVSVSRGGRPVLEDVTLRIAANDYLAILGPNGSGKSTLLKVILGLIEPDAGRVRVFGAPPRRARGRVGYVPQRATFDLDFPIRVRDVVSMGRLAGLGLARLGRFARDDREAADAALERVEMAALADRPIGALSGGQLQRVLIARALAQRPRLLLLDEPTSSLDERIGRSVWELFEELSAEMAIVVVSHDIGAISRSVRSVACLNRHLFAHPSRQLTSDVIEAAYGCPIDLVAHGHPHRVLADHDGAGAPHGEG
ncbi:MAG: ABC transporter ATP-binding protein [Myxococcota bacterium]|nr:ABC transporter ATP-binding protein [Myxococcales bacterium]